MRMNLPELLEKKSLRCDAARGFQLVRPYSASCRATASSVSPDLSDVSSVATTASVATVCQASAACAAAVASLNTKSG